MSIRRELEKENQVRVYICYSHLHFTSNNYLDISLCVDLLVAKTINYAFKSHGKFNDLLLREKKMLRLGPKVVFVSMFS